MLMRAGREERGKVKYRPEQRDPSDCILFMLVLAWPGTKGVYTGVARVAIATRPLYAWIGRRQGEVAYRGTDPFM